MGQRETAVTSSTSKQQHHQTQRTSLQTPHPHTQGTDNLTTETERAGPRQQAKRPRREQKRDRERGREAETEGAARTPNTPETHGPRHPKHHQDREGCTMPSDMPSPTTTPHDRATYAHKATSPAHQRTSAPAHQRTRNQQPEGGPRTAHTRRHAPTAARCRPFLLLTADQLVLMPYHQIHGTK